MSRVLLLLAVEVKRVQMAWAQTYVGCHVIRPVELYNETHIFDEISGSISKLGGCCYWLEEEIVN